MLENRFIEDLPTLVYNSPEKTVFMNLSPYRWNITRGQGATTNRKKMNGQGLKISFKTTLFSGNTKRKIIIDMKGIKKPAGPLVIVASPIVMKEKIKYKRLFLPAKNPLAKKSIERVIKKVNTISVLAARALRK
jgi:hypothetical protein